LVMKKIEEIPATLTQVSHHYIERPASVGLTGEAGSLGPSNCPKGKPKRKTLADFGLREVEKIPEGVIVEAIPVFPEPGSPWPTFEVEETELKHALEGLDLEEILASILQEEIEKELIKACGEVDLEPSKVDLPFRQLEPVNWGGRIYRLSEDDRIYRLSEDEKSWYTL
jgi:hypothetical protein